MVVKERVPDAWVRKALLACMRLAEVSEPATGATCYVPYKAIMYFVRGSRASRIQYLNSD